MKKILLLIISIIMLSSCSVFLEPNKIDEDVKKEEFSKFHDEITIFCSISPLSYANSGAKLSILSSNEHYESFEKDNPYFLIKSVKKNSYDNNSLNIYFELTNMVVNIQCIYLVPYSSSTNLEESYFFPDENKNSNDNDSKARNWLKNNLNNDIYYVSLNADFVLLDNQKNGKTEEKTEEDNTKNVPNPFNDNISIQHQILSRSYASFGLDLYISSYNGYYEIFNNNAEQFIEISSIKSYPHDEKYLLVSFKLTEKIFNINCIYLHMYTGMGVNDITWLPDPNKSNDENDYNARIWLEENLTDEVRTIYINASFIYEEEL